MDVEPAALEHRGGQLRNDDRHEVRMNVSLLCPSPDYVLDERFMKAAHENAAASGGRLAVTHEISDGLRGCGRGLCE